MTDTGTRDELARLLTTQRIGWIVLETGETWLPNSPHGEHQYDGACAVCRCGDMPQAFTALLDALVGLVVLRTRLDALLPSLVEDEDCWFDHHGGCQAHGYLSLEPGEVCPQQQLKELVAALREDRTAMNRPTVDECLAAIRRAVRYIETVPDPDAAMAEARTVLYSILDACQVPEPS